MSEKSSRSITLPVVVAATVLTVIAGISVGRILTAGRKTAVATEARPAAPAPQPTELIRYKIPVLSIQPTRGPADALVTINEFCDLRGPVCRESDVALAALLKEYDGKLRWAQRTRIDMTRPEADHRMHAFARAAFQRAGKFWEMRQEFLKTPDGVELTDKDYERITKAVGLEYEQLRAEVDRRQHDAAIALDNVFSIKFGVTGELGIFVNGRPLIHTPGADLKAELKPLIEQELVVAERLVQSGVPPEHIYDEITKDARWGVSETDEMARRTALAQKR